MLRIETPKGAPGHRQEIQRGRDAGKPRLPGVEVAGNGDGLASLLPTGGGVCSPASVTPNRREPHALRMPDSLTASFGLGRRWAT
jgi:hypothetical protein